MGVAQKEVGMKNLITCLVVCVLSCTALADTWTVDDDGAADFNNIQAAVDAASNGDEIIVAPGTYTSTVAEVVNMRGKEIWLHSSETKKQIEDFRIEWEKGKPELEKQYQEILERGRRSLEEAKIEWEKGEPERERKMQEIRDVAKKIREELKKGNATYFLRNVLSN